MVHFCIKLAGIPIEVSCQFPYTEKYCAKYLSNENPQVNVTVKPEDLLFEREQYNTGKYNDKATDGECYYELSALLRKICDALVPFNVLLLHSSAISVDNKGYLFTAKSGVGKSTHAALWCNELTRSGHTVFMINDDKPLIKISEDDVLICGTPWSGKHYLDTNSMVSLRAIGKIEQNEMNIAVPLSRDEYWITMIRQCYMPKKPELVEQVFFMLQRIIDTIPCYKVLCNMEPAAAQISWEMMSKKGRGI